MTDSLKCVVIGAGPVGALAALYAARRGWDVEVYDLRGDLRDATTTPLNFTKSINLALSERGINSMRQSGHPTLVDDILADTIPMYGRMIHGADKQGTLTEESQQYDVHGRFIRAVDRAKLNATLLDELEGLPNVKLHWHHKVTGVDFRRQLAWIESKTPKSSEGGDQGDVSNGFKPTGENEIKFDLILGCDGAHSAVRFHLMKYIRMDFAQTYIDTLWCEFTMPPATGTSTSPSATDGFVTSPNHLHIWPGSDKMFIAIPSTDKTFTCTLFASSKDFAALEQGPSQTESFFNKSFPGAADLIGPGAIQKQFEQNPHLPLVSIKCSPHFYGSSGVILGDAAHAMVPFYGQGMNAGLEDVRVLFEHLDAHPTSPEGRTIALAAYNAERVADAHTINDLALGNYWEMHAGVRDPLHLLRKHVEEFLSDKFPSTGFATQYSRVSFSNQRYSEVVKAVAKQKRLLIDGMLGLVLVPAFASLAIFSWKYARSQPRDLHNRLPGLARDLFRVVRDQVQHVFR